MGKDVRWDKVKVVLDAMEVVANLRWLLKISRFSPSSDVGASAPKGVFLSLSAHYPKEIE